MEVDDFFLDEFFHESGLGLVFGGFGAEGGGFLEGLEVDGGLGFFGEGGSEGASEGGRAG